MTHHERNRRRRALVAEFDAMKQRRRGFRYGERMTVYRYLADRYGFSLDYTATMINRWERGLRLVRPPASPRHAA